jgi:hypothetical protein
MMFYLFDLEMFFNNYSYIFLDFLSEVNGTVGFAFKIASNIFVLS